MEQNRQAHVRIVTPITTEGFRTPDQFADIESQMLRITLSSTATGPASIECAYEVCLSEPGTIDRIIEAERDGADAVVIDCMADPALSPARECVNIPVFGPSQTSMHLAGMLSRRFSILTVLPRMRVQFENLATVYGLSSRLAGVHAVNIPVLELEKDLERTKAQLIETAIRTIEEDDAHAIIFGCTGLLGCAMDVRQGLVALGYDVPVIDPIPATVRIAAAVVHSGLSHSKLTSPAPPRKSVIGYSDLTAQNVEAAQ